MAPRPCRLARAAAAPPPLLLLPCALMHEVLATLPIEDWLALSAVCSALQRQVVTWRSDVLGLAWPCRMRDGLITFSLRAERELTPAEASELTGLQVDRCVQLFPQAEWLSFGKLLRNFLGEIIYIS